MTENLVKTGNAIWAFKENHPIIGGKEIYLILPKGLDALEEMLRKELTENLNHGMTAHQIISSVFDRFKKEQGL